MGLPFYVARERKPENGCEVQDVCGGISGILMRLKIVKKLEEAKLYVEAKAQNNPALENLLNHGTEVLLELLRPWRKASGPCWLRVKFQYKVANLLIELKSSPCRCKNSFIITK